MHRTISYRQALLSLLFILGSSALISQVNIKERVEIKPSQSVRNTSSHTMQEGTFFEPLASPDQLFVQTSRPCIITATCKKLPPYDPESNSPNDGISFFLECDGAPQGEYWLGATGVDGISIQTVTFNATSCASMHVAHSAGGWGAGESLFGECIVTVSATSATFQLNGEWRLRRPITAIVTLTVQPDTAYDLASLDISAAPVNITQCYDYTEITISTLDKRGEPYSGISCDGNPTELMTVSVPPSSKATLEYPSNGSTIQGKDLTLPAGDMTMTLRLHYQAGDPADSVVVTVASQGKSAQTTVYLSIDPTQPYLTAAISPGEVRYGLKSSIDAQLLDGCGGPITVPATTKFKFEITDAQQFGYLVDPATGKSGMVLDQVAHVAGIASVEYRAYGQEPSALQDVPLKISITDPSVAPLQTDIYVRTNDLRVTATKNPIHFGESTQLTVEKKNSDGTYSAIPSDWQTAFQLVYIDTNGYLYSPDSMQSGTTVNGAFQTASYYAKPRLVEPDSVDVAVFVTTVDPNVIATKANQGEKPKLGKAKTKIAGAAAKGKKPIGGKNLVAMDEPPDLGPGLPYKGVGRVVVKREGCIKVAFATSHISPGDTVLLTFTTTGGNGQPASIPANQSLDVFMLNDSTNGFLFSQAGKIGRQLTGATQPIWYVAPDSIGGDSVQIRIRAARSNQPASSGSASAKSVEQVKYTAITKNSKGQPTFAPLKLTAALIRALADDACSIKAGVVENMVDHFDVKFAYNSIAFTEATGIFVIANDSRGNEIALPEGVKLSFSLEGPLNIYGKFIDVNGDTLKSLTNVKYEDARMGTVQFAAVDKNPVTAAIVQVTVTEADDPTKTGNGYVTVLEQTLKIVMTGLREVRPIVPGEVRIVFPGQPTSRTSFKVQLTRGGAGVPNHPFELSTKYVDSSGAHEHSDHSRQTTPDAIRYQNYGFFELTGANPPIRGEPLRGITGADGSSNYTFQASEFGDTMRIRLHSLSKALLNDSVSIVEKVGELVELPDDDELYARIGGTCRHHGPSDRDEVPASCRVPDNNHYGNPSVIGWLPEIARAYLSELESDNVIKYNDISLLLGGGFDVGGNWAADISPTARNHQLHRNGLSVDVRTSPYNSDGVPIDDLYDLRAIVRRFNPTATIEIHSPGESNQHFHFQFTL